MKKIYVDELSVESQKLFEALAKVHSDIFNNDDIENGLMSKISDLSETQDYLGFRSCTNNECCEFFKAGFLFAGDKAFCSKDCFIKFIPDSSSEKMIWKNWSA